MEDDETRESPSPCWGGLHLTDHEGKVYPLYEEDEYAYEWYCPRCGYHGLTSHT